MDLYTKSDDSKSPQRSMDKTPHISKEVAMPPRLEKIPLQIGGITSRMKAWRLVVIVLKVRR